MWRFLKQVLLFMKINTVSKQLPKQRTQQYSENYTKIPKRTSDISEIKVTF